MNNHKMTIEQTHKIVSSIYKQAGVDESQLHENKNLDPKNKEHLERFGHKNPRQQLTWLYIKTVLFPIMALQVKGMNVASADEEKAFDILVEEASQKGMLMNLLDTQGAPLVLHDWLQTEFGVLFKSLWLKRLRDKLKKGECTPQEIKGLIDELRYVVDLDIYSESEDYDDDEDYDEDDDEGFFSDEEMIGDKFTNKLSDFKSKNRQANIVDWVNGIVSLWKELVEELEKISSEESIRAVDEINKKVLPDLELCQKAAKKISK